MSVLNTIDINLFSLAVLLIIINYIRKESGRSNNLKYYKGVLYSTLLVLVIVILSWIIDGKDVGINYLVSWLLIFTNGIPVTAWFLYLDYKARRVDHFTFRKVLMLIPMLVLMLLALIQLFTQDMFTLDNYTYIRGPLFIYAAISIYISYFVFLAYIFRYRKYLFGRLTSVVMIFSVLPLVTGILQIFMYGINLLWPSMSVLALYSFIYVEQVELLRDDLTGLLSRGQLEQHLNYKLKSNRPFSIIMIDMDGFKKINDTYGHDEGDIALQTFSSILSHEVKLVDSVCRYGGDEFIILLESEENGTAEIVIDRIYESIDKYNKKNIKSYDLAFSAGYKYVCEKMTALTVLYEIDQAMYKEKNRRKE